MITQTHHGVTIAPYYQHYTSFISNSTSSLQTLGVSHISRQNSYSFCPKSTQWSILIFSRGQGFLQGTITLKMHKSSIDHISHILRMAKILLHRVTTHKIHISTNDANFIHSQMITISCFSITCLNSTPQYKRKCSHFYYSISFVANSTI